MCYLLRFRSKIELEVAHNWTETDFQVGLMVAWYLIRLTMRLSGGA